MDAMREEPDAVPGQGAMRDIVEYLDVELEECAPTVECPQLDTPNSGE